MAHLRPKVIAYLRTPGKLKKISDKLPKYKGKE